MLGLNSNPLNVIEGKCQRKLTNCYKALAKMDISSQKMTVSLYEQMRDDFDKTILNQWLTFSKTRKHKKINEIIRQSRLLKADGIDRGYIASVIYYIWVVSETYHFEKTLKNINDKVAQIKSLRNQQQGSLDFG